MNESLLEIIRSRMETDESLDERTSSLLVAACQGRDQLEATLEGKASVRISAQKEVAKPPGVFLQRVRVQGFRGIGPPVTLDLTPGPGLTLVVGRNGSGKSSLAEGLEMLFTGESKRWSDRSQVWREGWLNLHNPEKPMLEAELLVEGHNGPARVVRAWGVGSDLDESEVFVQPHGKPKADLDALGWSAAVESFRPFLSYSELGAMFDAGPSKLYDALSSILGLDDLVTASELLRDARLSRERALKDVKQDLSPLLERLREVKDERAEKSLAALLERSWNLDEVENILLGPAEDASESEISLLRQLSTLESPALDAATEVCKELRGAAAELSQVKDTEAERDLRIAELLESALEFHESHGDADCPVCGRGYLDAGWRDATKAQIATLRARAEKAEAARRRADAARTRAKQMLFPSPPILDRVERVGLEGGEAREAFRRWTKGRDLTDMVELADHLESNLTPLMEALEDLRIRASKVLEERETAWRPVAASLAGWLKDAREAKAGEDQLPALKNAETWLKATAADIRNERFHPIADEATRIWEILRQQSNVELGRIELEGTGTKRRVALDVRVDGVDGAALGVMSQGELNSLALSLFLPRATLPESPFRFVVIDDPVQSMDPARVDGLARVLEKCAKERQVLVFTHDARLFEAIRRLQIKATVIEVTRRAASVVELRAALDPVSRYLEDARALASTEDLPSSVALRVVPGFCRMGLEAACMEAIRRRRLGRGESHQEVERLLESATRLTVLVSWTLFDDGERGGEVMATLNKRFGKWAGDVFKMLNKGAHQGYEGDLLQLVRDAESLSTKIQELP
jgi:DNA repair exonuclease SbcCD ATPase subunit